MQETFYLQFLKWLDQRALFLYLYLLLKKFLRIVIYIRIDYLVSNLSGYRLLCEGTFDENNINQELEVFDYSKLSDTKKITALEIICIGSETRNHIASSVTKYAFLTLDGDHVPAKIFDIKTTLCNLNFKFNISVDARKRKIIVSCAKSGYKYSIYSIEHTMNIL